MTKFQQITWLVFIFGFFFFPNNAKLSTYFYLFVAFPTLLILLSAAVKKNLAVDWQPFVILLACPLLLALSNFWVTDASQFEPWFYIKQVLLLLLFFFCTFEVFERDGQVHHFLTKGLLFFGALNAAYALFVYWFSGAKGDLFGINLTPNQNATASMHAVVCLTAVYLAVCSQSLVVKILLLFCGLPPLAVVILSHSQMPIVSLVMAIVVMASVKRVSWPQWVTYSFFAATLCFMMAICFIPESLLQRLVGERISINSFTERAQLWTEAVTSISSAPFLGLGIARHLPILRWNDAHNLFFDTLRVGGAVSLVLLLVQLAAVLKWGHSQARTDRVGVFLLCWLFIGLTSSMYYSPQPLTRPRTEWFLYWIPIAIIMARHVALTRAPVQNFRRHR